MGRSERSRFARGFSSKVRTIKKPYPTTNKNQLNKLIKTCKDFLKIRVLIHITYFLSKKIGVVITSGELLSLSFASVRTLASPYLFKLLQFIYNFLYKIIK